MINITPKVGNRWGLLIFGGAKSELHSIKEDMPLIKEVTQNISLTEYIEHHLKDELLPQHIPISEWAAWAASKVYSALEEGFDSLALVTGSTIDLDAGLPARVYHFLHHLSKMSPTQGTLLGVCFDLEWENEKFSEDGWRGYVDNVSNAVIEVKRSFPIVRTFGPGGTHSDDKTLPIVLERLETLEARFDHPTFHAYPDQGWDGFLDRLDDLRDIFNEYGYDSASITEVGVTGQKDWSGDGLDRGTTYDRHLQRFARIKRILDNKSWIKLKQIYQINEPPAPDGEEHGWGFGMYDSGGILKPTASLFQGTEC